MVRSEYYSEVGSVNYSQTLRQDRDKSLLHNEQRQEQRNDYRTTITSGPKPKAPAVNTLLGGSRHAAQSYNDPESPLATPTSSASFNYAISGKQSPRVRTRKQNSLNEHSIASPVGRSPVGILTPQSSWVATPPRVEQASPSVNQNQYSPQPRSNRTNTAPMPPRMSRLYLEAQEEQYRIESLEREIQGMNLHRDPSRANPSRPVYQDDHSHDSIHRRIESQCGECLEPILDTTTSFRVESLSQWYHPACFQCDVCHLPFSNDRPFVPHEGKAYCEADYSKYYLNPCSACKKPIQNEQPVYAFGRMYHDRHVRCTQCKVKLQGKLYQYQHQLYCAKHYESKVSMCPVCKDPIQGPCVQALGAILHRNCFGCETCRRPFPNKQFFVHDNKAYCKLHYHTASNTFCYACNTPIEGVCLDVSEQGRRYHPDCWRCRCCDKPIQGVYFSLQGYAYCSDDIDAMTQTYGGQPEKRLTYMNGA